MTSQYSEYDITTSESICTTLDKLQIVQLWIEDFEENF
jgi:hypothetical protein